MTALAYLLDENADPRMARALRRRWPDMRVLRVGDGGAPSFGTSDPEILIWCEANAVSLVTHNRRSMPVHLAEHLAAGRHVPGIFVIDDSRPMGELVERLGLIWGASEAEEYYDQIIYLTQVT